MLKFKSLTSFWLFIFINLNICAQSNSDVHKILDGIIQHAETVSLYRNRVDWPQLLDSLQIISANANSISDLGPALNHLMATLGDEHGRVFHQNQILANYYSGEIKPHQTTFDLEIFNQIQMRQKYPFHAELLENRIGYIRIIGLSTGDNLAMAKEIQDALCNLSNQGAFGWVIDLRYNGGGNLIPMAEGIANLIGDGPLGGTKGLTDNEDLNWYIENGDFYFQGYTIGLANSCTFTNNPKVAVLTSVYTASSGEALAVIFKGREQTRFFGQKTLGLITTTDYYPIDDQTGMTLSVGYYQDRMGNVYNEYVDVDFELPFAKTPLSEDDTCLTAALNWLKEN